MRVEKFNPENNNDLIELEKKLYNAFVNKIPNNWVQSKYIEIEKNRLRPNRDYNNIDIFLIKNESEIISSIGFHFDLSQPLELEDFDFVIEKKNICEGLFFFIDGSSMRDFIEVKKCLIYIKDYLTTKNIKYFYGTCDDSLFKLYKSLGFDLIEKRNIMAQLLIL